MKYYDSNKSRQDMSAFISQQRRKTVYERIEELEARCLGMQEELKEFSDKFGQVIQKEQRITLFTKLKKVVWSLFDWLKNLKKDII